MPVHQKPVAEWPSDLHYLLEGAQIASGSDGKRYCRLDVEVDADTLLFLHEFEAHVRHRQVRLRLADTSNDILGEMNPLVGLGGGSDRTGYIAKVRISFHDLKDADGVNEMPLA